MQASFARTTIGSADTVKGYRLMRLTYSLYAASAVLRRRSLSI